MALDLETPVKTCKHCGSTFTEAQSSGNTCFKCKVTSIGWTWRGPTRATKQNFHDFTIRDVISEGNRHIEARGESVKDYESTTRWV